MVRTDAAVRPRIAIPLPHGGDPEYALRAIPQYERAIDLSGGDPVRIPLGRTPAEVMKLIERCDGVVLPGSKADVDPAKFDAARHPKTEAADALRDTVDELLLQDAYNMRKPVLGICYGLQILNVYRSGNLVQHIESSVNHEAGRKVPVAHNVAIEPESKLAEIVADFASSRASVGSPRLRSGQASEGAPLQTNTAKHAPSAESLMIPVNSSHHQAAGDIIGDGLKIVARCPDDSIIEALEGTSPDHFVLAVQWHPERSFDDDPCSRAIFAAVVKAARQRHEELSGEFEASQKL
jgi:putative glutamine amidotransferase